MVSVNGEEKDLSGKTLTEYLLLAGYNDQRVAVERNGDIVPRAQYEKTVLQDGDRLEVVSFVGGG